MVSVACSTVRAHASTASPSVVSTEPRGDRLSTDSRQRASKAATRADAAGWLMPSSRAALTRLPWSWTATISRNVSISTSGVITNGYHPSPSCCLLPGPHDRKARCMTSTTVAHPRRHRPAALLVAGAAAAAAVLLGTLVPLAGPLLTAMLLGAAVANSRLSRWSAIGGQAATTKLLLRLGIVLLGLRLSLDDVVGIGLTGLVVIVTTVVATYSATTWLGTRLGLDRGFVTLMAAGFSICGAAAIAAVDDVVRAKERWVALALALVTIFGTIALVALPWAARRLGLSAEQSAVWAGASIHEVAQVVAAASLLGSGTVAVAMTVKLGRVLLLAPTYAVAARQANRAGGGSGVPTVPWFVLGFGAAVALRSSGAVPAVALPAAQTLTTLLLAAGMFGLGLGLRVRDLWPLPARALVLATTSTLVAAGTSLVLVAVLV